MLNFKNSSSYILAGTYLAYGISGKINYFHSFSVENYEEEKQIEWVDTYEFDFKRLDFGLKMGIGLGFKHYNVSLNYKMGLTEISNLYGIIENPTQYNRVLTLSLSYYLPK